MILQPTSPFRRAADIRGALARLAESGADSIVSVSEVPAHLNPMRMLTVDNRGLAVLFVTGEPVRRRINRRQDMPPAWVMNGAIYACRTGTLFDPEPSLYGASTAVWPMSAPYDISIDTPDDWAAAEHAIRDAHGS
jgi:N-acylneuraminate cytidylyltransferase